MPGSGLLFRHDHIHQGRIVPTEPTTGSRSGGIIMIKFPIWDNLAFDTFVLN